MSDIPNSPRVYLVMAYRYGTNEYFFPVGIYGSEDDAIKAAKFHRQYRGGKYDHKVFDMIPEEDYDAEGADWKWVTGPKAIGVYE